MTEPIDSTSLLEDAIRITGMADDLLARLETIEKDTPAKVYTYEMIKEVIEIQSQAIRNLVAQQVEISDRLNQLIPHLDS